MRRSIQSPLIMMVGVALLGLSGCATSLAYLKEKINPDEPAALIGYQTMTVRENAVPEVVIDFDINSWALNSLGHSRIDALISANRTYLVEGTAGGLTGSALNLSRKRTQSVIGYLEAQGVQSNRIFVVQYDPDQAGRQVRLYTITR